MPDDLVSYALDCAPPGVADALRWLEAQGFHRSGGQGGPSESFGNVLLDYERDDVRVRVTRDRSQWFIELTQVGGQTYHPLNVLLTAMTGDEPDSGAREQLGQRLPAQLPPGVSWADSVPSVIEWLSRGNRSEDIAGADARWRSAMKAYLER